MKKSSIVVIGLLAVATAIIISMTSNASTYVTFTEAREKADQGNKEIVHVVGVLKKDANGQPIEVAPSSDMLSFTFTLVDNNGQEESVYHAKPMPTDFLRLDQVVVKGYYHEKGDFLAEEILLKCPSKYEETEI